MRQSFNPFTLPLNLVKRWRRRAQVSGLTCGRRQLALVGINTESHPCLYASFQADVDVAAERHRLLTDWAAHSDLYRCPVTLTLLPDTYQLLQIERPPVKTEELAQAVRWQIKDLLKYPLNEAVVDVFEIPVSTHRHHPAMVYVAAARRKELCEWTRLAVDAGLVPDRIDIAELALRNLIERATLSVAETVATLCLLPGHSLIQISRGADLYLTRTLDYGMDAVARDVDNNIGDDLYQRLTLELQRTLDYYDSEFGLASIKRVFLAPAQATLEALATAVSDGIGLPAEFLNLTPLIETGPGLRFAPAQFAVTLLGLGGRLDTLAHRTAGDL
ncbi:MAG: biosis protein MshI [Pseudomonadota bacterium]|nr:biosis protein MshI [Pseudomonadota bacterium]